MSGQMKRNFAAMWDVVAKTVPDAMALIEGDKQTDWRTYEDRAARLAAALVDFGIQKDSKVAIYGYNSASWIEAHYAIFKARAVPVNVNYRYTASELEYLLENSDAEVIFFDAQFSEHMDEIKGNLPKLKATIAMDDGSTEVFASAHAMEALISEHEPLPPLDYSDQDLFMLYTGGTTGMPKGVVYHVSDIAGLLADASFAPFCSKLETWTDFSDALKQLHASGEIPVTIPACPLMHGTGLSMGVLGPHIMGGCVLVYRNKHLDTEALLGLIEQRRATDISIVGDAFAKPMIATLQQAAAEGRAFDLSSLKRIRSSGAMFSLESKQALLEFADVTVMDSIAASEGSLGMSVVSRQAKTGTGKFQMGPKTKVFDENMKEVEPGSDVIGLVASSHVVPLEYYKDPEKSAATFREIDGVRYTIPGDYAKVAEDGSLILMGRGSNCINTGGEKVYPEEVEETLKLYPQVVDSLVVGVPDDRFGQKVVGIVEADSEAIDEDSLIEFSRQHLAGYKIPRSIIVADKVQRAPNGKADYKWARSVAYEQLGIEAT